MWLFKIGKLLSLKEHIFFQSILPKLSGWGWLTAAFLSPVFRRAVDTFQARPRRCALPGRARILPLAAPGPPPSLGRALGPGPRVTGALSRATMGSEMEPLLRAWSYFRRRKFQLCADLCTQMLEKSPYDQVPADPRQSVNSLAMAVGSGGSLCPLG